jgi:hypothetical protein
MPTPSGFGGSQKKKKKALEHIYNKDLKKCHHKNYILKAFNNA